MFFGTILRTWVKGFRGWLHRLIPEASDGDRGPRIYNSIIVASTRIISTQEATEIQTRADL